MRARDLAWCRSSEPLAWHAWVQAECGILHAFAQNHAPVTSAPPRARAPLPRRVLFLIIALPLNLVLLGLFLWYTAMPTPRAFAASFLASGVALALCVGLALVHYQRMVRLAAAWFARWALLFCPFGASVVGCCMDVRRPRAAWTPLHALCSSRLCVFACGWPAGGVGSQAGPGAEQRAGRQGMLMGPAS